MMIKDYFKFAWRNILRNKKIFGLNIFGLAVGLASCLFIILFIKHELSYDRFNKKADQIARVVFNANINGEQMKEAVVMAPVAKTLKKEIPEVIDATRLRKISDPKIVYENQVFRDTKFAYVDPNFFEIFTLPIMQGDALNPLGTPNSVVLTKSEAKRVFGNKNPLGETIFIGEKEPFKVTAVMEDVPENSHFHFDVFASLKGYGPAKSTSWVNSDFFTYLLLKEGVSNATIEAKLPAISEQYMGPQIKEEIGVSFAEFSEENSIGLFLQPLTDIHLHSDFIASTELEQGGNIQYLYLFGAVAVFMVLIACINFMNLSTAAASKRAKEIGIRKVMGSNRNPLIYQFLIETFISSMAAILIAIGFFVASLPVFNYLSGKSFTVLDIMQLDFLISLIGLGVGITAFAGIYPALFLSSFKPVVVLKSKFSTNGNTRSLRNGLVVFQFIISAALILGTLVVNQQMNFIQNKELGYNKDQILVLRESYLLGDNMNAFKNEVSRDPRVVQLSHSAYVPSGESDNSMSGVFLGEQYQRRMFVYNIDENYISTLGMSLLEGRNFSEDHGAEFNKAIINQEAAKVLGIESDAIGKTIFRDTYDGKQPLEIIGVVRDFHFKSLHKRIDPLIMLNNPYGGLILRVKTADIPGLLDSLKRTWKRFDMAEPFTYSLLDDSYNKTYLAERRMSVILNIFTVLTIIVACLGLFGLITFTAEQRFKEIGIRKVLGSSIGGIIGLLSKDLIKLVCISFLIAFPLGYYFMEKWLQDFAYRIDIEWWMFLLAAVLTLLVAFLTIGYKSIEAATTDPVKSLRTE